MKHRIDYEIACFDRYLSVLVDESVREKAESVINKYYHKWHLINTCECCEEYILKALTRARIKYEEIPDLDCLDYQSLFLMGNKVNIIFGDGSEMLAESVDDIANLDGMARFELVEE